MRRSITEIANAWYASSDEVLRFGAVMLHADQFDKFTLHDDRYDRADALLEYFEKPWHWDREYAWWVASGHPDHAAAWEQGEEMDWEVLS